MRKIVLLLTAGVSMTLVIAHVAFGGEAKSVTWNVAAGEQANSPAGTPKGASLNQFFPARLEVNAGDKVTFSVFTFHTVSYLGASKRQAPFLPDPAKGAYEGITDAAGQPFYFEGKPKFVYNGGSFAPFGPKTISGKTPASSGALFARSRKKPGTATYAFPKTGAYKLVCLVHPGMQMQVVVKAQGATVQSAADVAARAKAETDAAWAKAKALVAKKPASHVVTIGIDGPQTAGGRTTILDFLPDVTRVKVGDTVTFVNRSPTEVHNATFGPLGYIQKFGKQTDLFPMGPNSKNQVTPILFYGTDPPSQAIEAGIHGNGFFAGPLTDGAKGGLPGSDKITFDSPGKYHFICFIHGKDMAADVVVTK